jgi:hypothetical protein
MAAGSEIGSQGDDAYFTYRNGFFFLPVASLDHFQA